MIESTALAAGAVIERRVRDWIGIDLMRLSRSAPMPSQSGLERIFTLTRVGTECVKLGNLCPLYIGALLCYHLVLFSAAIFMAGVAERARLRQREKDFSSNSIVDQIMHSDALEKSNGELEAIFRAS